MGIAVLLAAACDPGHWRPMDREAFVQEALVRHSDDASDDAMEQYIVVVPCYNEEKRLQPDAFIHALSICPNLQWLFVNDGSTDDTLRVLQTMRNGHEQRVHIHDLEQNRGKGEAVRRGLLESIRLGADVTGYFDADLATPISEILRLIELTATRSEKVILGSRVFLLGHHVKRSRWRYLLGRAFATASASLLKMNVHDTQCGAKIIVNFDKLGSCLERPFQSRWLFDVELISRLIRIGDLKMSDFYEEPLLEWTDVAGSKLEVGFLGLALWEFCKIIITQKRQPARNAAEDSSDLPRGKPEASAPDNK